MLTCNIGTPRAEIRRGALLTWAETGLCTAHIFSCTTRASSCRKSSSTGLLRLCAGSAHTNRHADVKLSRIRRSHHAHETVPTQILDPTDLEALAGLLVHGVEVSLGQSEQLLGVAIHHFEREFTREQLQQEDASSDIRSMSGNVSHITTRLDVSVLKAARTPSGNFVFTQEWSLCATPSASRKNSQDRCASH